MSDKCPICMGVIPEINEVKIERLIEELRTSTGKEVYAAFFETPRDNLLHMKDMIDHILEKRKEEYSIRHLERL